MNTQPHTQPEQAETPQASDWVTTIAGIQKAIPCLGSTTNINRMIVMQDGIPHRRLGKRLLFNVPEVLAWMNRKPGRNLPEAS